MKPLLLLLTCCAAGCGWMGATTRDDDRAGDAVRVTRGEAFWLDVGQTALLASDVPDEKGAPLDETLTFTGLVDDSRCPEGVACVWAGMVRVAVARTHPAARIAPDTLTLGGTGGYDTYGPFQLLGVAPLPTAQQPQPDASQYRARFVAH